MFGDIQRLIDADAMVVSTPDHPVLMTPPDVLVAKNGKILAFYKVHSGERASPNRLLSRLTLCRLALPTHAQHLLIIDENICGYRFGKLFSIFDKVLEIKELKSSLSLLNGVVENSAIERASEGREEHYVKYNILYESSLKQNDSMNEADRSLRVDPSNFEKAHYADWLRELGAEWRRKESRYFYRSAKGYFAVPDFQRSKRKHDLLRNLCIASVLIGYSENMYSVIDAESRLLLSDGLPGYSHDSLKGIRSASFAGLGLSHAKNEDSVAEYSEHLSYRLERGWHEFRKEKNRYNKRNRNR